MSEASDFVIVDGVLKEYKGRDLIVVVPDGVTKIATGGLGNNVSPHEGLDEVILPDSVREIHKNAFFSKTAKAMIRAMFMQMGRKPSEAQIRQVMKSMQQ